MKITIEYLKSLDACEDQVELFKKFLGKRKYVLLTGRNLRKAKEFGLYILWLINRLPEDDKIRKTIIASGDGWAIKDYAQFVDKCPREDTRNAVIASGIGRAIFEYALDVDHRPREDTRNAVIKSGDGLVINRYRRFEEEHSGLGG